MGWHQLAVLSLINSMHGGLKCNDRSEWPKPALVYAGLLAQRRGPQVLTCGVAANKLHQWLCREALWQRLRHSFKRGSGKLVLAPGTLVSLAPVSAAPRSDQTPTEVLQALESRWADSYSFQLCWTDPPQTQLLASLAWHLLAAQGFIGHSGNISYRLISRQPAKQCEVPSDRAATMHH